MFQFRTEHKSDRLKLFVFLFCLFLAVGFSLFFLFHKIGGSEVRHKEAVSSSVLIPDGETKKDDQTHSANLYDQSTHFTPSTLSTTKQIAITFIQSYYAYDANHPSRYIQNSKPYMTSALYQKMKQTPRREPLDRTVLSVKNVSVTPVANKSEQTVWWNVMVQGTATDNSGNKQSMEDWYLVGLRQIQEEWKVEDVKSNVSS